MRIYLVLLLFLFSANPIRAQNSFSFNCTKDTIIGCTSTNITLHSTVPNIFSSTASYSVYPFSSGSCFRGYVSPAAPGPSANLIMDDRYSPLINITFPFYFFGNTYNSVAASTNGFITFDISKALSFSHYGILANGGMLSSSIGSPQDLPSTLYDGAIIMGPYHDLDPNNPNNIIPAQQIKYDVIGVAPYRKWVISFYKVPLYTTACLNLATNTHQIVLYETLGIVEVFIYDKEICNNWNKGRAMIGMQDITKSNSIMAPGRMASSMPWGSQGMNESWRFFPVAGNPLFKKSELFTLAGTLVQGGIVTTVPNNQLDVTFNNLNPPPAGEIYVVRTVYNNPVIPGAEIISTDTINVSRGEPISTNINSALCSGGNTGSIIITAPTGPMYEYSLDGTNWQSNNIFTVSAGTYNVKTRIISSSCISNKSVTVTNAPLTATIQLTPTACAGQATGTITISPNNGTAPFQYSINNNSFQSSNVFAGLAKGSYDVRVTDARGCSYFTSVQIIETGPTFSSSVQNIICGSTSTGSVTVTVLSGSGPFQYSIDGNTYQTSNVFSNLIPSTYNISVMDANSCISSATATLIAGVSYSVNFKPVMPSCFGNNNGSITVSADGVRPMSFSMNGSPFQTDSIFNNIPAGTYDFKIRDSLGCIKDTTFILQQPNAVNISAITTSATSCSTPDGSITIKANGGTTPYWYSIDTSKGYSVNNFFNTRSGTYNIVVSDSNKCSVSVSATVIALSNDLSVDIGPDKNICQGDSLVLNPVSTPASDYFSWNPSYGLSDSSSGQPKASPSDTTKYILTAKSGYCSSTDSIILNVLHKPIVNAGNDTVICYKSPAYLKGYASNLSGPVSYNWIPASEISNPNNSATFVWPKESKTNFYTLQVSDKYGCNFKVYDQVKVRMQPPVPAFAGNDTIATIGEPIQLSGSGGVQYMWSPAGFLNDPAIANPVAILPYDTRFKLEVTDSFGCTGYSTIIVKAYKNSTYYIPNAFTPNNDGLNDEFKAIAPGIMRTFFFRIYNRWGVLMFQTQDMRKGWDGTYNGIKQPTAVYIWVIKGVNIKGEMIDMKGTVTLIR